MRTWKDFFAGGLLGEVVVLGFAGLHIMMFAVPLSAQNCPVTTEVRTICQTIGNAESVSVTSPFAAYPALQPVVYWHDDNWKIDMLPQPASDGDLRMKITSSDGREKIAELPADYAQVDSISRTPSDNAIVIADINGKITAFGLVDLKLGKLIDNFAMSPPSVSPNRRFILYVNTDYYDYYNYRLYDTSKTPRENTCGYRENDPEHKDLDEGYRGFPVYPRKANQTSCSDAAEKAFADESHTQLSNFVWSADSYKAVFADLMNGNAMSLILVTMPKGENDPDRDKDHDTDRGRGNDRPRTLIYSFVGAENVCGAVGPLGKTGCDSNNVRSLAWNGDAVNVALVQANPTGPAIVKNLTIPLSKFMPIRK